MSVQFYVYISKKVCNDVAVPTKIYMCMHLYPYVYSACNREVLGSSATRSELFSRNFDCLKKTFSSWKWVLFPVRG